MSSEKRRENVLGAVGDAAQNCPLPRRVLILPKRDTMERIQAGSFYEIDHAKLPNDTPTVLYSLRAVMVTAKTEQNVTIVYPSVQSLQAFFAKADRVAIKSPLYPAMDGRYVLGPKLAVQVLGHEIPFLEFVEYRHSKSFWLIKCFKRQQSDLAASIHGAGAAAEVDAKYGTCFSMLQRSGVQWGSRQIQLVQSSTVKQPADAEEAISALVPGDDKDVVKGEEFHEVEVKLEERPDIKVKEIIQYSRKRKHEKPIQTQCKNIKPNPKQEPLEIKPRIEVIKGYRADRWSARRYEAAVEKFVEVLKTKKAFYGNPITRVALRTEARKQIGDTGLLDHLLKHLAGKVVPSGGNERLRRRCDPDGKMGYWLESADLVNIRKEAGVKDPYWTPPPGWKPGDCITAHICICCKEVRLLKDELNGLRRKLTKPNCKDEKLQVITEVLPESATSSGRFNNADSNVRNSKVSYELLVKKKSVLDEQLHKMSKALMELEEDMKKFSSKAEATRNPLIVSYSKSSKAKEMTEMNRNGTEDLAEETSEGSSESDDEDFVRENQVTKILRPIRLRACTHPNNVSNITSHALDCSREYLVDVTPPSASPHSTTTS